MKVEAVKCDCCGRVVEIKNSVGVSNQVQLFEQAEKETFKFLFREKEILSSNFHICINCTNDAKAKIPGRTGTEEWENMCKDAMNVLKRKAVKNSVNRK